MNCKKQRLQSVWRFSGWVLPLTLAWLLGSGLVFTRLSSFAGPVPYPPTLDPTYGLPLPKIADSHLGSPPAWIWASTVGAHQHIYLYRSIRLSAVPVHPVIYVTADNYFTLYVNGEKVTARLSGANAWSQARRVKVARYLHPGENTFAIKAANDGGPAGVILWLIGAGRTLLETDGLWRVAGHVAKDWITHPAGNHWYPATVEAAYGGGPWGYSVTPWPLRDAPYLFHLYFQPLHVTVLHGRAAFKGISSVPRRLTPGNAARLRPGYRGRSPLAPARRIHLTVQTVGKAPYPELLISFGQEVAGRIQVAGTGGTVLIGTGESRGEALYKPWGGVHKLKLSSHGITQSTPYSAFRYATVSFTGKVPVRLDRLRLDFKYYPVKYRGAFACSDPLLTKIWYTGAYTAHLCMQEQIWDAPKRDRAMWMGDLQVSGEVINNVFLDRFLMEKTMRLLRAAAQGGRPATALPVDYVNNIPGYSNAWICGLADFYKHTGAIGYIRSQHQLLLSMLRYMKQGFNRKNIFVNKHKKWCFVDWAPELNGNWNTPSVNFPPALAATDLYACWAVRRAVFLLNAMGDTVNAAKYAHWERQLIAAARRYLASPKTETYTDLRQVNAMAIDSHVADAQQRTAIYKRILRPEAPSWKQQATPYYNNFVLFAVGHLGHTDEGLNFAQKYWGGMIREGATTFWEAYDNAWPKKHFHRYLKADNGQGYFVSLCHGWSSGVTNWLTEHVLGIQTQAGGFSKTTIVPHLGYLHWVSGRVPTPHGNIVLRVARHGAPESLRLTLPPGIKAMIGVVGRSVTVNGVAVSPARRMDQRCYFNLIKPGVYHVVGTR
ncbi:MAG: alpha-L-rhamnosidase-related protein [Phycisphaerae bacterium]